MSALVQSISNLGWKITNGAISSVIGGALDTLQSKLANGGRDEKVKFYWDYAKGGAVWNVIARSIVGGAVDAVAKETLSQYKKLIGGTSANITSLAVQQANKLAAKAQSDDENKYGHFPINNGKDTIDAYDQWGTICTDALMLGIIVAQPVSFQKYQNGIATEVKQSDHLVWYDTTALINLSSDKNLILTQVSGRDYSRKELVSNGDLNFSVSGHIVSNIPDIYPNEEVQKLRQILQYKGIVDVNNEFLDQWGIKKIVIKSFSFPSSEGKKAIQDYSFEAVGIQPDKEANVTEDTIQMIDYTIASKTDNSTSLAWKDILSSQLENLKSLSVDLASQGVALAEGYLDKSMAKDE
jgi:hypothetical protein